MKKAVFIAMAVAILALPIVAMSNAFAERAAQPPGPGHARHHMNADISEQDLAKMDAERTAFFKETKDLRFRIEDKAWELNRELRVDKPDEKKAMALQKELSDLRGQLDQKFLSHRLRMRALFPNADFFGPGAGRGYGPGGCAFGDRDDDGDRGGCGRGMMNGGGRGNCSGW